MELKLWVNDTRDNYQPDVITVRSAEAFKALWMRLDTPWNYISTIHLDHDLGEGMTGMDILNILECDAYRLRTEGYVHFPEIFIHTANAAVRPKMQQVADKINGWFNTY